MKQHLPTLVASNPIFPVLNPATVEAGVAAATALRDGGIKNVEVVLRSDAALETITAIRETHSDMLVGVGTLLTPQQVNDSILAGAQFLVTPATSLRMLASLLESGLPILPGVATPTEVATLYEAGVTVMKFFPAGTNGGPSALKAIGSVFKDVQFCPTGGVNGDNMKDYLAINNVFAVGGSWMLPAAAIANGQWQQITELSQQLIESL